MNLSGPILMIAGIAIVVCAKSIAKTGRATAVELAAVGGGLFMLGLVQL